MCEKFVDLYNNHYLKVISSLISDFLTVFHKEIKLIYVCMHVEKIMGTSTYSHTITSQQKLL